MNAVVYSNYYAYHRGNIVTDEELDTGVYCYADIDSLAPLSLTGNSKDMVIGVISGWLAKSDTKRNKLCLDARSCKLVGIIAPIDTNAKLPWVMPEEDKLAFRVDPQNLMAPAHWMRCIWNWKHTK